MVPSTPLPLLSHPLETLLTFSFSCANQNLIYPLKSLLRPHSYLNIFHEYLNFNNSSFSHVLLRSSYALYNMIFMFFLCYFLLYFLCCLLTKMVRSWCHCQGMGLYFFKGLIVPDSIALNIFFIFTLYVRSPLK